jgi:polyphosphate:AMP phosphotransferase
MFESAELGHAISKADYKRELPPLREALLDAQLEIVEKAEFPVLVLISGVEGAGKGETVNLLNEWMDPRHIQTQAFFESPTDEERQRPPLYRFFTRLPKKGKIGIFFGSWYTDPIISRVEKRISKSELEDRIERIVRLERMLANDGVLFVKLWFHLSKKAQKHRLEDLEKDPKTSWRVRPEDWKAFEHYDGYRKVSARVLRQTSTPEASWTVIEGTDARYRSLTAGKILLETMRARLDAPAKPKRAGRIPPSVPAIDKLYILRTLDMSQRNDEKEYDSELLHLQGKLNKLSRHPRFQKTSVVVMFEGWDAAGKGGAIRRITGALDARQYHVIPIAAPTEDERAQPYLWRFWRYIPKNGRFTIYDRSWYGRVLVERVEGYAEPEDWMRAYGEINDFEEQLIANDVVLLKFWLQITKDEQLKRFKEREKTGFKRFKITRDDWRNRDKWEAYELAACDMIDRTSTEIAQWTLVEANDKHFARLKTLRVLTDAIEKKID